MKNKENLAIFISGGGSTCEAIIKHLQQVNNGIEPTLVISSTTEAGGIAKAKFLGVETVVMNSALFKKCNFGKELVKFLQEKEITMVSLNGYLKLMPVEVINQYKGKIINQHPGPIGTGDEYNFGGKGMIGENVHLARVIFSSMTEENDWTEVNIHHVEAEFDTGKLIKIGKIDFELPFHNLNQEEVIKNLQVLKEIAHENQQRLLPIEHETVIKALDEYANVGYFPLYFRKDILIKPEQRDILEFSKKITLDSVK
ncbi:MAG: formyltransferase family protein [bacterium]